MKNRDLIIGIIALVFAYLLFRIVWFIIFKIIEIVVILMFAYIIYLFLKKVL